MGHIYPYLRNNPIADPRLNVYYLMLEKVQSFADGKYDLNRNDIEDIYLEQRGDAAERIEELQITKRIVSTAKLLQQARQSSGSGIGRSSSIASKSTLDRKTSTSSYSSPTSRTVAAPPPYTSTASSGSIKKAPPPPPPLKPKPSFNAQYATAIFDYEAQAEGDLSFRAGDRIEIVEKSDNVDDWWTGKINGQTGIFPGNYTQVDA